MRFSVLSVFLLGCGNNAPEITINPNPAPAVILTGWEEPAEFECTVSAPNITDDGNVATYNLDSILDSSGCEEYYANYSLSFSPGAESISFSCNSEAFTWWRCDLPLVKGAQEHRFTFGDMDGSETEYEPLADPIAISECSGRELGIIFWATREGANTLCADEEVIDRGFQIVEFPTKAASIVLNGSL